MICDQVNIRILKVYDFGAMIVSHVSFATFFDNKLYSIGFCLLFLCDSGLQLNVIIPDLPVVFWC